MANLPQFDNPELLKEVYHLFRDYFDRAEKKRRWLIRDDIPWDQCNPHLNPAVADVVETFCAVELFLPDYLSKLIPPVRADRGRAWMLANWGYEESKHSMALGDWLSRSGHRTEEQMFDLDTEVFSQHWDLPYEDPRGMACYTMFQELATWLHYQNLRKVVGPDDPALHRVLTLISIDERAHYDFFRRLVGLYLEEDRQALLEQMRGVLNNFQMPAVHLLAESSHRVEQIKSLHIFSEETFYYQVMEPALADLGLTRQDLRKRSRRERSKSYPTTTEMPHPIAG